jgi:CRISPR-associated protein Csb2
VSGHLTDGRPSQQPHIAFLPLAHVGHEHADGHLLGVALALPRSIAASQIGHRLNAVAGYTTEGRHTPFRIYSGSRFEWTVELELRDFPPVALQSAIWTRASARWATVTPVVFDRHLKRKDIEQAPTVVADACERIGLPRPTQVALAPVSLHVGVPHSRDFPPMVRKSDNGRMYHTHAVLTFAEPVVGPVLIGAGRYLGYGLCRPVWEEGDQQSWEN